MKMRQVKGGSATCDLCCLTAAPEGMPRLGQMYQMDNTTAHHFCLMLASGLAQNGQDDEGILGFLPWDIEKEVRRGLKLRCYLCKKSTATVGCSVKTCLKSFHLPCILASGGLSQFYGSYNTFCCDHRPKQRVPEVYWKPRGPSSKVKSGSRGERKRMGQCGVCLDRLTLVPGGHTALWTPCCKGWFHRKCVESMAEASGCHFFKCPLCNNKEVFEKEMLRYGIYLPDRDAVWETEDDAYQELYIRHDTCDAKTCICPSGRKGGEEDTDFELILCELCGSKGVHATCASLDPVNLRWKCQTCLSALKPRDQEEIEQKLDLTDGVVKYWAVDNDSTDTEEGEMEEEVEVFSDSEVFEKCFKSSDDRIWSALTSVFKIDVEKIDLENTEIANRNQVFKVKTEVSPLKEVKDENEQGSEQEDDQEFVVFNCEECNFDCDSQEGLMRHMKLHDPSRKFQCKVCGLRFEKPRHVSIHSRLHTGEKPWRCDLCGYNFSESWSLKLHMSKHDPRRKHPCDQCTLRFKSSRSLQVHVDKQHNPVKPEKKSVDDDGDDDELVNDSDDLLNKLEDGSNESLNSDVIDEPLEGSSIRKPYFGGGGPTSVGLSWLERVRNSRGKQPRSSIKPRIRNYYSSTDDQEKELNVVHETQSDPSESHLEDVEELDIKPFELPKKTPTVDVISDTDSEDPPLWGKGLKKRQKKNCRRYSQSSENNSSQDVSPSSPPSVNKKARGRTLSNSSDVESNSDSVQGCKLKKTINSNSVKESNVDFCGDERRFTPVSIKVKNPLAMILDVEKDFYNNRPSVKDEEIIELLSDNDSNDNNFKDSIIDDIELEYGITNMRGNCDEKDDIEDLLTDSEEENVNQCGEPVHPGDQPASLGSVKGSDKFTDDLTIDENEKSSEEELHLFLDEDDCPESNKSSQQYMEETHDEEKEKSKSDNFEEPTSFVCHLCPASFQVRWNLNRHMKMKHFGPRSRTVENEDR